ncbi:HIT domain-containing protein [Phytoactinopolyspora alkaliphila]|uniref:HIT domain-containing protein n=1 Tax=Phytoactinopolyspora alkaliphila TaxID=1783498 RepID=A0A6N9YMZ3_9ACTN|nr:HIT domain-containing protein [Phytoactinopolyspora alkaliphila]NED96219.1 HIT domain-containing protein [Phytoactinopolyspora alkaliphila]
MTTECYTCDREAEFDQLPPRERITYDNLWRVVHATGTALLGWLVLVPRRHVMELADLSNAEATSLGTWQVRLARAIADELHTPKTYLAEFGEAHGFHLHFHIIPRPRDLTDDVRGPHIFGLLGRADDEQVIAARDDLAMRLAAHFVT